jgi:hypothetical protein
MLSLNFTFRGLKRYFYTLSRGEILSRLQAINISSKKRGCRRGNQGRASLAWLILLAACGRDKYIAESMRKCQVLNAKLGL